MTTDNATMTLQMALDRTERRTPGETHIIHDHGASFRDARGAGPS